MCEHIESLDLLSTFDPGCLRRLHSVRIIALEVQAVIPIDATGRIQQPIHRCQRALPIGGIQIQTTILDVDLVVWAKG